ncbi:MAG: GNAT family N-acetyltransferase [Chloroflexota bacterium]|nr:GNAT family N-acetyltransferase [Chloroflexota bacterium]
MISEGLTLVMTIIGVAWLSGTIPTIARSWNCIPKYYNMARLLLPLVLVVVSLPQFFVPAFPGNSPWVLGILSLLLVYISAAFLFYLYTAPGDYTPRPVIDKIGTLHLLTQNGALVPLIDHRLDDRVEVRPAQPEDLPCAGKIFAEVFGQTFDLSFGPNRQRTAQILGELLQLKKDELLVADEEGEVIGAVWLDLADPTTPKALPKVVYPITRKYLDWWNAFYFAYLSLPGIMAVRGSQEQGYIQWLGVLPQWQGHHVARKLVHQAEERARTVGKKSLALHTERANKPARCLYEHLGFTEQGLFRLGPRVYYVKKVCSD